MMLVLMFLVGAVMCIAPWILSPQTVPLSTAARIIISGAGVGVLIITLVMLVISKLYRKASANMAFVRTGMGGAKPIKDGGTLVIPVVHQNTLPAPESTTARSSPRWSPARAAQSVNSEIA